jgi:hypothetical protein
MSKRGIPGLKKRFRTTGAFECEHSVNPVFRDLI